MKNTNKAQEQKKRETKNHDKTGTGNPKLAGPDRPST